MLVHVLSFELFSNIADFLLLKQVIGDCSGYVVYLKFEVSAGNSIYKPCRHVFTKCVGLFIRTESCSFAACCAHPVLLFFVLEVTIICSCSPKPKAIQSRDRKQNNCPCFSDKSRRLAYRQNRHRLLRFTRSVKNKDCRLDIKHGLGVKRGLSIRYGLTIKH